MEHLRLRTAATLLLWVVAGCGGIAYAGERAGDEDARAWLARTDQALTTRNYEGVFVHEHAGQTETLRVIHRVSGDEVAERLLSMDGSGREFIRRGPDLICYLPDKREVLVERSLDTGVLLSGLPRIDASSAAQYEVRETARTRVSGRSARVITITPTDDLRYGYRLWIDEATAMPLKSQLRDADGHVVDQIVFTSLKLPVHIADSMLQPAVDARGYRWLRRDRVVAAAATPGSSSAAAAWQAGGLPPGFRMTVNATQMLPGATAPVEHMVFSDGLASVSVFVETQPDAGAAPAEVGAVSLGSSSLYTTVVSGYRVTAIGEVPPDTVRVIAHSIRAVDTGAGTPQLNASTGTSAPAGANSGADPSADRSATAPVDSLLSGSTSTRGLGFADSGPAAGGLGGDTPRGFGVPGRTPADVDRSADTIRGPGPGLGGSSGLGGPGPGGGAGFGGAGGGGPGARGRH